MTVADKGKQKPRLGVSSNTCRQPYLTNAEITKPSASRVHVKGARGSAAIYPASVPRAYVRPVAKCALAGLSDPLSIVVSMP